MNIVKTKHLSIVLAMFCLYFSESSGIAAEDEEPLVDQEAIDSWYPRTATSDKATVVIYAPQVSAWTGFKTLTAWAAFRITLAGTDESYYGSLHFDAETDTDVQTREVLLHDLTLLELDIDGRDESSDEYVFAAEAIMTISRTVPLDLVLEYLDADMEIESAEGLSTEPPIIFASTEPALLLSVDGDPVFVPVGENELQFVINTNWDVLRVGDDGPLYFCYQGAWMTAPGLTDLWVWAGSLPESFGAIPEDENWSNVHDCLPDDSLAMAQPEQAAPTVFYAAEPAELLQLDGVPEWESIGDIDLDFATNTKQELFRVGEQVYFLISGRWFQANDIDGPWTMAADLPVAFREIPAESDEPPHPKSYVRKSVPGTQESWEATLVASIPRTAEIVRGTEDALNLTVTYAGEPTFTQIETTDIEMAVNTSYQVLRYKDLYYICHNAVWLTGSSATGPWEYADSVPEAFATIPASSPAYNTTFVNVDSSNDASIDYAYTSAYEGAYVEDSTVVYGTGYPSPVVSVAIVYGIYGSGWGYPHYPYYPWPPTYGYGSWYDPGTGRYGEAVVGYGPYGAAGAASVFNPETGVYGRGQAVWDNDEFAGRGFAYNPNTDTSIARNRYVDFEDNEGWSQRVAQRGDEWRYTESQWEDGRMLTEFESSRGTQGEVSRERQGDTLVSEGTVSRGDQEATFESTREREGDAIVSEGSITGEDRSATVDSVIDDGKAAVDIKGSEGGTGELNRQLEDGELTGSGSFTRDGKTVETDVTRTAEGVKRDFETSEGGQGSTIGRGDERAFVAESGSGDVYAGRDGNVYQKTDDGWSAVENPGGQASGNSTAADRAGDRDSANVSQYDRSQVGSGYGTGNASLERDFQSRQNGFDRYSQHQAGAGGRSRRSSAGRRRRP